MEAQNRESQMIEMSQWMTEVTDLLQSRLDADILAGDMPKENAVSLLLMLRLDLIRKLRNMILDFF